MLEAEHLRFFLSSTVEPWVLPAWPRVLPAWPWVLPALRAWLPTRQQQIFNTKNKWHTWTGATCKPCWIASNEQNDEVF